MRYVAPHDNQLDNLCYTHDDTPFCIRDDNLLDSHKVPSMDDNMGGNSNLPNHNCIQQKIPNHNKGYNELHIHK